MCHVWSELEAPNTLEGLSHHGATPVRNTDDQSTTQQLSIDEVEAHVEQQSAKMVARRLGAESSPNDRALADDSPGVSSPENNTSTENDSIRFDGMDSTHGRTL